MYIDLISYIQTDLSKTCTLGNYELNQFNTIFIEPSEKKL